MNSTAFVTGGSRGIGFAIAKNLCQSGYDVAINGVREKDLVQDVIDELQSFGTQVIYCRGDIGSDEDRERIVSQLRSKFDQLNVLVNNAGVAPKERLDPLKTTTESYDRVLRINLKGPFFLTQALAQWMIEKKEKDDTFRGSIINIGSVSATQVSVNRGEYCISKAGLAMHSRIWAIRLAEYDIPAYEIRPGIIKTDMTSGVIEKYKKLISEGLTVQPRWGKPEDVARVVNAMVRGYFSYSTGEVIMVDGGLTIPRL